MVRGTDGTGEKAKREKEDTEKEDEGRRTSEAMRINERMEVSTSELGEAEDHFELCEGLRSN